MTRIRVKEMAEELVTLKNIRAAYKGHCTKNEVNSENIMKSAESDYEELESILEAYTLRLEKISVMDQKIEGLIGVDDLTAEVGAVLEYTDKTLAQKRKIAKFLKKRVTPTRELPETPILANPEAGFGSPSYGHPSTYPMWNPMMRGSTSGMVKLPKMDLKPYSGDPLEWKSFWDSFEAAIDKNTRINDIEKMNYLKSYLKGDAERAIRGFSLSNENYRATVDLLKERFGQKQTLINAYMKALWNIPCASTDVRKLREFYDLLEGYIRGLESLEVCSGGFGPLLLPVLLERLPEEIRRELIRGSENMDLDDMRELLRKEIETRERSLIVASEKKGNYHKEKRANLVSQLDRL